MILSPGAKRSRIFDASGRVWIERLLKIGVDERAPRAPRCLGHRTWMSRMGSRSKRLGNPVFPARVDVQQCAAPLLLSYAELDAPVIASAIFHHTVTTAFYRPVFAGQGMGAPVTLRTQHGGINPCMSEGSPDSICTPLRQLHVGGWTVNAMSIATYLNYRSSWQLFDQTGGLPQKRLAARQNLGTIGTEINSREFRGRRLRTPLGCLSLKPDLGVNTAAVLVAPRSVIVPNTNSDQRRILMNL